MAERRMHCRPQLEISLSFSFDPKVSVSSDRPLYKNLLDYISGASGLDTVISRLEEPRQAEGVQRIGRLASWSITARTHLLPASELQDIRGVAARSRHQHCSGIRGSGSSRSTVGFTRPGIRASAGTGPPAAEQPRPVGAAGCLVLRLLILRSSPSLLTWPFHRPVVRRRPSSATCSPAPASPSTYP